MPAALSVVYCTADDLDALLSTDGTVARLDDDASGTLSAREVTYRTKATSWATSKVNFYCLSLYSAADLATSWLVNNWATICAAHWLSCRRGNPPPGSVDGLYQEAVEDMKLVKSAQYQIPDIGYREAAWPAWSNIAMSDVYALRKLRVERPISERTPTKYTQNRDIAADFIVEPN